MLMRYIISVVYLLLFVQSSFAQRANFIDLNKFLTADSQSFNDMAYIQMFPQFEENPDPKKAVSVEIFFGEYDGSEESKRKLQHVKEILAEDRRLDPKFRMETQAISTRADTIRNSPELRSFLKEFNISSRKVDYDQVPEFLNYAANNKKKLEKKDRYPSGFTPGRKTWTLVRFSSTMGGAFASLYYIEGLSAVAAAQVSVWPGLLSGAVIYYNNHYGAFITNGKWANWLLTSKNYFSKKLRKALNITSDSLVESLEKKKEYLRKKYPTIFEKSPEVFEAAYYKDIKQASISNGKKFERILGKLAKVEEYVKWWVTEVIFTGTVIKIPQALAGVAEVTSAWGAVSDVLTASTMGLLAQGPGDIAIQKRKYQMVAELNQKVVDGLIDVNNKDDLLSEIRKVLSEKGKYKDYTITEKSHPALVKIENWSRSRATFLSFFSVTGVAMEVAGIPLARPLLIATGVGGALYYSNVAGWFKPGKYFAPVKRFVSALKDENLKFNMQFLKTRYCSGKYLLRPKS